MAVITVEMQKAANVVPARCGKGKGIHYATAGRDLIGILCGYRSLYGTRPLTDAEAAKPGKECTRCIAAVGRILAMAAEGAVASIDKQLAAHHPQEPARYLADYVTRINGEQRTQQITVIQEGQTTPVLDEELPYRAERNAVRTLESLGWAITGMQAYGGPSLFRAWVEPSPVCDTTILLPNQARGIVTQVYATAQDFQTVEGEEGALLGYTFRTEFRGRTRYGFITMQQSFSMALESTREDAAAMLSAVVLSDAPQAQRQG
ncbi:hypothetical protein ACFV1C_00175 [Streptomyces sp. NPDC059605]|uniref:hypothetical protein n=1 Tax=Streptomyces sp. NPDC059605 TaxID=3346882 RepID=UPI00368B3402